MKSLITIGTLVLAIHVNGQTTNKMLATEINHELGTDAWSVQGNNIIVDYGSASAGRALWGIGTASYELKYEYVAREEMNVWVLYVKCKDTQGCIEDPSFPEFEPYHEYNQVLSGLEDRARRVVKFLEQMK